MESDSERKDRIDKEKYYERWRLESIAFTHRIACLVFSFPTV